MTPGESVEDVIYIEPLTCRCKGHHTRSQQSTATRDKALHYTQPEVFSCFKAVPDGESDCLPDPGRTGAEPLIHI